MKIFIPLVNTEYPFQVLLRMVFGPHGVNGSGPVPLFAVTVRGIGTERAQVPNPLVLENLVLVIPQTLRNVITTAGKVSESWIRIHLRRCEDFIMF